MVPRRLFIDLCCPESSLKGLAYVYKFAKVGSEKVCRSFNALEQNSSNQKCYNFKKRWLRFYVSTAGGMGCTPGWETKMLHTLYSVTKK